MSSNRQKGMEFPLVLDTISVSEARKHVALSMVEYRPWEELEIEPWRHELVQKTNRYLQYIAEGLLIDYPQLPGYAPVILILCHAPPPAAFVTSLRELRDLLKNRNIEFSAFDVMKREKIEI